MVTTKICLITGVGPGTGAALVKRFADAGYTIAMIARNEERLAALASDVADTHAYPCDVSDEDALKDCVG